MSINEINASSGTYFKLEHPKANWVQKALYISSVVLGVLSVVFSGGAALGVGIASFAATGGRMIVSAYQKYGASPFDDAQRVGKFLQNARRLNLQPYDKNRQANPWELAVSKCANADSVSMDDLRKLVLLNENDPEIFPLLKGADEGGQDNPEVYLALQRLRSFVKNHPVEIAAKLVDSAAQHPLKTSV